MLAVSSHDNKVYIFNIQGKMTKQAICNKSSSFITHIDWSLDSSTLRTIDGSYEILYYNAHSGTQDTSGASSCRDEPWATYTAHLGWAVQGIWPPGFDGSDINSVDRSHDAISDGYELLASADDKGMVKVFRFPSIVENSESVVGVGHSSHVTKVKFNFDDTYLLSTGGNDTSVMQWKVN